MREKGLLPGVTATSTTPLHRYLTHHTPGMLDPVLTRNVAKRLRPNSEQIRAVLSGRRAVSGSKFIAGRVGADDDARRVLAVVVNAEYSREEAGVFVFGTGASGELRTIATIPVNGDFHVSISQNNKEGSSDTADYLPSPTMQSIDITLSIEGGRDRVSVIITNTQALQDFIASARGLKELFCATEQLTPSDVSHQWLRWYNPSILSSKESLNPTNYHQYLREPHHPPTLSKTAHGAPGDDAADLKVLEEAYIRQQMRLRIKEYSTSHPLLLHTATFNVNGKAPSERLYSLLGTTPGKTHEDDPLPDIFVFGFQELDLSTEALLYLSTTEKEEAWFDAIMEDLGEVSKDCVKLVSKQLVGMLIIVIVKKSLRPHIHHIHSTSSGQGYMWLGNKGGVAVRFRIYDTVFTFINSHLAASRAAQAGSVDDMIERRNADFTELRRVLKFPEPAAVPAGDAEYTASGVQHSGILESDYTFWIINFQGDQNYRIDLSDGDVRELVADAAQTRDYSPMFPFDQLKIQRDLGKCFTEFSEGRIAFIP
ncbi:hypothetical protein FS837_000097 [Tulasnella sp. UAMH 9824]|nr:hypothetical protein FS837_000097 [Tulasnella sp. UAMH 9824]